MPVSVIAGDLDPPGSLAALVGSVSQLRLLAYSALPGRAQDDSAQDDLSPVGRSFQVFQVSAWA